MFESGVSRDSPTSLLESAHEDSDRLARVAALRHPDFGHPLDPLEALPAGSDESHREAVVMGELLAVDLGGQQRARASSTGSDHR